MDTRPPRRRAYRLRALAVLLSGVFFSACGSAPERPSVLLVTIDTLRADHLGCYGYTKETSPAIDRLAAEGVRVVQSYATAPITAPSHASLLTGLYPARHGVRTNGIYALAEDEVTLAELLADRGYRTAAFVGAVPLHRSFGFAQGFETFDDDFTDSVLNEDDHEPWYGYSFLHRERRADEVVEPAMRWLGETAAGGDPFFLWVHLFDPHHPYQPPKDYQDRFGDPDAAARDRPERLLSWLVRLGLPWHKWLRNVSSTKEVIARYDGEIAYADRQVGRLLDALERLDRAGDTVVVLTADHGEGLGEHGEYYFHGDHVFETTARVPLILRAPWRFEPGTVAEEGRASGIDVLPTVLELLSIEAPAPIDGVTLVDWLEGGDLEPRPLLVEAAYRDLSGNGVFAYLGEELKLIWTDPAQDRGPEQQCYDVDADPRESLSLCSSRPQEAELLALRLAELRAELERDSPPVAEIPPELLEALESLGYTTD